MTAVGARPVDIRPARQRAAAGEIPSSLGLAATDLDGGSHAWAAGGLPVTSPGHATPVETIVPGAVRLLDAQLGSAR